MRQLRPKQEVEDRLSAIARWAIQAKEGRCSWDIALDAIVGLAGACWTHTEHVCGTVGVENGKGRGEVRPSPGMASTSRAGADMYESTGPVKSTGGAP